MVATTADTPAVVDASVAFKWVVGAEVHEEQARALLADSLRSGTPLVCPPHLFGEVANGLYQRARTNDPRRHLTQDQVLIAIQRLVSSPLQPVAPPALYREAFRLARQYALPSLYDALYVVLAQLLGAELWTADQRLLTALSGTAPWVTAIDTYPIQ